MSHHCHAIGCKTATRPELLMCAKHWRMVSTRAKVAVLRAYRQGQCDDKQPSSSWMEAANQARGEVAELTGHGEAFRKERESFENLRTGLQLILSPNAGVKPGRL